MWLRRGSNYKLGSTWFEQFNKELLWVLKLGAQLVKKEAKGINECIMRAVVSNASINGGCLPQALVSKCWLSSWVLDFIQCRVLG